MARRLSLCALAAVLVAVVAVLALNSISAKRPLRALFVAALQLRPGNEVRIAGRTVGDVRSVSLYDGQALVVMGIDDGDWPLHAGTTATLRFGSAAAYASRYVQLMPGPARNPALASNALLPAADTVTPVEFDQIFSSFDRQARSDLGGTLQNAAQLLSGQATDISRALRLGAPGVSRTAGLLGDLGIDPAALSRLVNSGAATFTTLASNDAQLQGLVTGAAQTFSVFADNADALKATIGKLPGTLQAAQGTLTRLNHTLGPLSTLVTDLRPGAAGLATDAPLLRDTLAKLLDSGPALIDTLKTGSAQLPQLTHFVSATEPFLPSLSTALRSLAPMVACLRPYSPEIAGYLETWQSGAYDQLGHYGRTALIQTPIMPGTSDTSAQAIAASDGQLTYAFPRPPGLNAGQPWFQPQCGAGPDALNANDDPEAEK